LRPTARTSTFALGILLDREYGGGVGVLSRLFRILHPLHYAKRRLKRAIVPRPIRRASWIVGGVTHPVSRARYSVRRSVIRGVDKAITPKRKRRLRAAAAPGAAKPALDFDDVTQAVAAGAGVPVERLRQFRRLVAAGSREEAGRLFTNEEGLRIAAAYREANHIIRTIGKTLPKP
jgi:hypothetical protein